TKSANIWDLMAPLGEKVRSNSDRSTDHATILPAKSGFLRTFLIGKSVLTSTLWLWKYCLSFLVMVTTAKASLSILRYLTSAPLKVLLTK
ncbi:hypothetical protein A2U01_0074676, partial [Trifolium medium]|nr:hypothetical protein [Trifolium medium]